MADHQESDACRICTIHLERLCYRRAWWFRLFREFFATGIRCFAWLHRIDPRQHTPRAPTCTGCIRFRKNILKNRSALFRWLDGHLNPVFNRVRDSLLTPDELAAARDLARRSAAGQAS